MSAMAPAPQSSDDDETVALLGDSARDFCTRSLPVSRLRALRGATPAYDAAAWRAMCELGWAAILLPSTSAGSNSVRVRSARFVANWGRSRRPSPCSNAGRRRGPARGRPTGRDARQRTRRRWRVLAAALLADDERPAGAGGWSCAARATAGVSTATSSRYARRRRRRLAGHRPARWRPGPVAADACAAG